MKSFTDAKFWISLIATLAALGILQLSESEQAQLVQAIVTVGGAAAYIVSVAIAQAQRVQSPEAIDRNILTDAWQRMSEQQAAAHNASMQYAAAPTFDKLEQVLDALLLLTARVEAIEERLNECEADS